MSKKQTPITLPVKTQATLRELIQTQRMLQGQIDAIIATARDLLNVPADWQIASLDGGFVPPVADEEA